MGLEERSRRPFLGAAREWADAAEALFRLEDVVVEAGKLKLLF